MPGCISFYQVQFPGTGRMLRIRSDRPALERVTAAAERKGIACVVSWEPNGPEPVWVCHVPGVEMEECAVCKGLGEIVRSIVADICPNCSGQGSVVMSKGCNHMRDYHCCLVSNVGQEFAYARTIAANNCDAARDLFEDYLIGDVELPAWLFEDGRVSIQVRLVPYVPDPDEAVLLEYESEMR